MEEKWNQKSETESSVIIRLFTEAIKSLMV